MPDAIEYIVRPYVTPDSYGNIIIPSTPRGSRDRATLTWGQPGNVAPAKTETDGVNFEVICCQEALQENTRTSKTKRIFQNGDEDSENWVDVERPQTLKLKKKEHNKCGDDWDAFSGVGQEISSALAEFAANISSLVTRDKNCAVSWAFVND